MFVVKVFRFNPIQENTYLLYNEEKECIIVDPGCYFEEEREELLQFVTSNQLTPKRLINTHCHLDHVFGNKWVSETFDLELYIHPNEKQVLDHAVASGLMWNLPFDNYNGPIHYFDTNKPITIGNDVLEIRNTPGHSPGSVSFYNAAQHFVIGGDVLFKSSIGRTDLPGGDFDTLIQSIKTQLFTLPDETVVYSGHGDTTTIGFEKMNNPFLR